MPFEDSFIACEVTGAEIAPLHFIEQEQEALLVAEFAQAHQVFGADWIHPTLALDAFEKDRDRRGRDRVAHRLQIVEWNMPEARRGRPKTLLHLLLSGGGDAGESTSVK